MLKYRQLEKTLQQFDIEEKKNVAFVENFHLILDIHLLKKKYVKVAYFMQTLVCELISNQKNNGNVDVKDSNENFKAIDTNMQTCCKQGVLFTGCRIAEVTECQYKAKYTTFPS